MFLAKPLAIFAFLLIVGALSRLVFLAFRRDRFWGMLLLLMPLAVFPFACLAWSQAKRAVSVGLLGCELMLIAFFALPHEVIAKSAWMKMMGDPEYFGQEEKGGGKRFSFEERLARLREREQNLLALRASLQPGERVEELSREIALYNSELKPVLLEFERKRAGNIVWRENLDGVVVPKKTVKGDLHGNAFTAESVTLENGILSLRQGHHLSANQEWVIFLCLKNGESPANRSFEVKPGMGCGAAYVFLRRRESGGSLSSIFTQDYTMRLRFGAERNNTIPGEIYVSLPDPEKSYAAGTFLAVVGTNSEKQVNFR
ncbi:MAG: hypothetical protein V4710_05770 [Verrucomicrobiota bacterium]